MRENRCVEATVTGPEQGDAFGQALVDLTAGTAGSAVIERDDGWMSAEGLDYLEAPDGPDLWAVDQAVGRVLDVGAGAGRASLLLQDRGQEVLALDTSAGAVQVCRQRGVRETYCGSVRQAVAGGMAASFDSALLIGNNLSLIGSPEQAIPFLEAIADLLRPGGVIAGTCLDPSGTTKPVHLDYRERNRRQGRLAGQMTFRIRYERLASDWFDWLLMSPAELAEVAAPAGWLLTEVHPSDARYGAVLARL
jgi:SAM-dependent methyltransferase